MPSLPQGTNTDLAGQAPFSPDMRNVFLEIEDKRLLPPPPLQKVPQTKRDMSKFCQYQKDHRQDTDDCRHLKIEIEKLIQRG
ncbi:hypothetical protein LIER_06869 [Lithospermum erythrorhizon]|uniref:Uncharacterized protein n=1 Tax=Lithospermum erythrorhizon TaxID=34254 RepID=A0AAV3PAE7_LITER